MPFLSSTIDLRTTIDAPGGVRTFKLIAFPDYFSPLLGKRFRVLVGTETDGISDGALLQSLLPSFGQGFAPAALHDSAYKGTLEVMNANGTWGAANLSKNDRDLLLSEALISVGFSEAKATAIYEAVALFGEKALEGDLSIPLPINQPT